MTTLNPLSRGRENAPASLRSAKRQKAMATPSINQGSSNKTPMFAGHGKAQKNVGFQTPRQIFGDLTNTNANTPAGGKSERIQRGKRKTRRKDLDLSAKFSQSLIRRPEDVQERKLENKLSEYDSLAAESLRAPRMSHSEEKYYSMYHPEGDLDFNVDELIQPKKRRASGRNLEISENLFKLNERLDTIPDPSYPLEVATFAQYPIDSVNFPDTPMFQFD